MKIIRTVATCAIAGSALIGGVSLAAAGISSAAPAVAVAGPVQPQTCPYGTTYEYGACLTP